MSSACSDATPGADTRESRAAVEAFRTRSLDGFLAALASAEPVPGGGAAGAVAGALAAALVAMVCRVTARRGADPGLEAVAEEADRLRDRLTSLAADDGLAYASVIAAGRRPAPEREAARASALRRATEIPLAIAESSRDALALAADIAGRARPSTRGDLRVAAILARAAVEAGAATADENLADLPDRGFAAEARRALDALGADRERLARRIAEVVGERGGPGA